MINEVLHRLENENLQSAIFFIEAQGDHHLVPGLYSQLVKNLYWKDLNASNLLSIGQAGIDYCLKKAEQVSDEKEKNDLKSWAKSLAFDMAANSWPYWGDQGVVISAAQREEGLKAAKLNLELAIELNKSKDKLALAYWLIGIHYFAKKDIQESLAHLNRYKEISLEINDSLSAIVAQGYIAIVEMRLLGKSMNETAYQKALSDLESIGSEDACFYGDQIKTVLSESANKL
jgi:hypothetical protein